MSHVADDLPRLLTGEAERSEVLAAAAHLRGCVDCQQELVSAVVAHASLSSAQRFAPELLALHADRLLGTPVEPASAEEVDDLPDLSSVFEQARLDARAVTGRGGHRARRPGRRRLAVAAAVAGLVIGAGSVGLAEQLTSGSAPSGSPVALTAYGVGTHQASARLGTSTLSIDATALPQLDATHRYEVWLTNSARTQMQPVGWIGTNGKAQLTVPHQLVNEFDAIEVSVQKVNAPSYDYSGTSVLRGTYQS